MRWKSGASPKLATSSRGCTRCSATPSSTSPGRTWRAGTSGSMVRTSGAVFPRQRNVLAIAERNAWRKIHEKMHEGNTLKAAMLSVRQDTLFWTREVYEKIKTFSRGRPSTRTSMDYAPPQKGKNKSKGKGKSKGKPGNKGKGKPPT